MEKTHLLHEILVELRHIERYIQEEFSSSGYISINGWGEQMADTPNGLIMLHHYLSMLEATSDFHEEVMKETSRLRKLTMRYLYG